MELTKKELETLREFDTGEYDAEGFAKNSQEHSAMCASPLIGSITDIFCDKHSSCDSCMFNTPSTLKYFLCQQEQ